MSFSFLLPKYNLFGLVVLVLNLQKNANLKSAITDFCKLIDVGPINLPL